ncbi:MAG: glycosyltransferase [Proteobacteria bacterium]|nr:glycosyltransferase [Pseudomonadota bacterium]
MKVIFFTYAYPPLKYPRSSQIARLVKHSRHAVHVVCCEDDSPQDETLHAAAGPAPRDVTRLALARRRRLDPRRAMDLVVQPDSLRRWALGAGERMLSELCAEPETILVTFGQPMSDHLAGLHAKRKTDVRWLAHFSDPWADSPYRRQRFYPGWHNRRMERNVVSRADRVVFTSEATRDLVMNKYPPEWRDGTCALPHAFDASLYDGASAEKTRDGNTLVLRYIGNFYNRRWPTALMEGLEILCGNSPDLAAKIRIELIGPEALRAETGRSQLPTGLITLLPPVPYLESLRLMREADLLLVLDAPFSRSVFLPSKLVDYMGAGKPIFAVSPPGPSADLVTRLGGVVANVNDPHEIAERLAETIEGLRTSDSGGEATWGDQEVRAEFAAPAVTARFDALIDEVAGLERVQAP